MASPLEALAAAAAAGHVAHLHPPDPGPHQPQQHHHHHLHHPTPQHGQQHQLPPQPPHLPYVPLQYQQLPVPFPHHYALAPHNSAHHPHLPDVIAPQQNITHMGVVPSHPHLPAPAAFPLPFHQPAQRPSSRYSSASKPEHRPTHSVAHAPLYPRDPVVDSHSPTRLPSPSDSALSLQKRRRIHSSTDHRHQVASSDIDSDEEDHIIDTMVDRAPSFPAELSAPPGARPTVNLTSRLHPLRNPQGASSVNFPSRNYFSNTGRLPQLSNALPYQVAPSRPSGGLDPPASSTPWFRRPSIVWYRRHDLRVSDHPALNAVMKRRVPVVLVFVLDDWIESTRPSTDNDKDLKRESDSDFNQKTVAQQVTSIFPQETPIIDVSKLGNVGHINNGDGPVTTFFSAQPIPIGLPGDPLANAWTLSAKSGGPSRNAVRKKHTADKSSDKSTLAEIWMICAKRDNAEQLLKPKDYPSPDWNESDASLEKPAATSKQLSIRQQQYLYMVLDDLCHQLRRRGATLVLRRTQGSSEQEVLRLADEIQADSVHWNSSTEQTEICKEHRLKAALSSRAVRSYDYTTELLEEIDKLAGANRPTCFRKFEEAWFRCLENQMTEQSTAIPEDTIRCFASVVDPSKSYSLQSLGLAKVEVGVSRKEPSKFSTHGSIEAPDLELGNISARARFKASCMARQDVILKSLAFHDFCSHLSKIKTNVGLNLIDLALETCPVTNSRPITRRREEDLLLNGKTGFPVVDAAMRHLHHFGSLPGWARAFLVHFSHLFLHCGWKSMLLEIQARSSARLDEQSSLLRDCLASRSTGSFAVIRERHCSRFRSEAVALVRSMIPELYRLSDDSILQPWKVGAEQRQLAGLNLVHRRSVVQFMESCENHSPVYVDGLAQYPAPFLTASEGAGRARAVDLLINRLVVSFRVPYQPTLQESVKPPPKDANYRGQECVKSRCIDRL